MLHRPRSIRTQFSEKPARSERVKAKLYFEELKNRRYLEMQSFSKELSLNFARNPQCCHDYPREKKGGHVQSSMDRIVFNHSISLEKSYISTSCENARRLFMGMKAKTREIIKIALVPQKKPAFESHLKT